MMYILWEVKFFEILYTWLLQNRMKTEVEW